MGIDGLDLIFRLEKAFGVKFSVADEAMRLYFTDEELASKQLKGTTATVGEIHQRLCELLRERKLPVPEDSWERVAKCVGDTLMIPPATVRPEHRYVQDLGAT